MRLLMVEWMERPVKGHYQQLATQLIREITRGSRRRLLGCQAVIFHARNWAACYSNWHHNSIIINSILIDLTTQLSLRQDCLSIEGIPPANVYI